MGWRNFAIDAPDILWVRDGLLENDVFQHIVDLVGVAADETVLLVKDGHALLGEHADGGLADRETVLAHARSTHATNAHNAGRFHLAVVVPFPTRIRSVLDLVLQVL